MKKHHLSWLVLVFAIIFIAWISVSRYISQNASSVDIEQIVNNGNFALDIESGMPQAPDRAGSQQFTTLVNPDKKAVDVTFADGEKVSVPIHWEDWEYYHPYFNVYDINFDGLDDLILSYSEGAYNEGTRFYAQHPTNRTFAPYLIDTRPADPKDDGEPYGGPHYALGMFGFDAEKREASSFYKGRGLGDIYILNTFKFYDGAWHIAETEAQDAFDGDSRDYYVREIVKYDKRGKSLATTTEYYKAVEIKEGPDAGSIDLIEVTKAEAEKHAHDAIGG